MVHISRPTLILGELKLSVGVLNPPSRGWGSPIVRLWSVPPGRGPRFFKLAVLAAQSSSPTRPAPCCLLPRLHSPTRVATEPPAQPSPARPGPARPAVSLWLSSEAAGGCCDRPGWVRGREEGTAGRVTPGSAPPRGRDAQSRAPPPPPRKLTDAASSSRGFSPLGPQFCCRKCKGLRKSCFHGLAPVPGFLGGERGGGDSN